MARPKTTAPDAPQASDPLVTAIALVRVKGGGWSMRTYLVPLNSHADETDPDTFGAAMGRATREFAKEAR